MLGAINLLLNARAQSDIDMQGYKLLNLDTSNLGEFENQIPFLDSEPLIKGSSDATKQARFEVDGFSEEVIRVFTLPNYDGTLATRAGIEAFENKTSYNGLVIAANDTAELEIQDSSVLIQGNVLIAGPFTVAGGNLVILNSAAGSDVTLPVSGTLATTAQLPVISDTAYNEATWNGNLDGASKNAIRDKIETLTAASSQPFPDNTALIKGSANSLKQFRIEVDGLSVGLRVMTPPDYDFTPASIAGEEALIKKTINGLTFNVGDAASGGGAVTYDETPASPFALNLVAISQVGTTCVLRTTAPTDIVLPVTGTVATVAGTIPFAYLSVNKDLGGSLASDVKVSTQLAIKTYVDSRVGAGVKDTSDDTVASATSVDLSTFNSTKDQIEVTGTTDIEAFVLDEGEQKVLVFADELNLIQGSFLNLKGGRDMTVKAGSYVVVKGLAGGVVELVFGKDVENYIQDAFDNIYLNAGGNIGFGNLMAPYFDVGRSTTPANPGSFLRFTESDHVELMKHDLSCGVALDISGVTTSTRTLTFPDSDGTLGLLVAAPGTVNDAGEDGQWAKDTSFVYVYHVGNSKWGRAALSYVW